MRMKSAMILYLKYVSAVLQSTMQYKVSFGLTVFGRSLVAFNGVLGLYFLFSGFDGIKDYSYGDVMLCYAVIQMSFALAECFAHGFNAFSTIIIKGELDRILLRPRSPILQVLGSRFDIGRVGLLLTGIVTLAVGISSTGIQWNPGRILTLALMVLGGALLFAGLFLIGATICFFSLEDTGIVNILTYGAKEHGKYPIDVYGRGLMRVCTYIIPYTLVQYYPLRYLLGKSENWHYGLYPVGIGLFLVVCYGIWRFGLRRYQSCGS